MKATHFFGNETPISLVFLSAPVSSSSNCHWLQRHQRDDLTGAAGGAGVVRARGKRARKRARSKR